MNVLEEKDEEEQQQQQQQPQQQQQQAQQGPHDDLEVPQEDPERRPSSDLYLHHNMITTMKMIWYTSLIMKMIMKLYLFQESPL